MSVLYAEERLADCIREAEPLLAAHWAEIARNKDIVPLAVDVAGYFAAEEKGRLLICTARRDGRLVGYAVWFFGPQAHYTSTIFAESDVFWVEPAERGFARVGLRLFEFTQARLKAHGVRVAHARAKLAHPAAGRLFEHMGYAAIETVYAKLL